MFLTGFADEAAPGIDGQIRATRELGWDCIEARNIDGTNIHDIPDAVFDVVCGKLRDAGVQINCFGSAIANWGTKISDPFEPSLPQARRAIGRMRRLGTRLIRIMSYAVLPDRGPDDQMAEERFARLRKLQEMFSDAGIVAVHENCMNYGGMGWAYALKLLENVPGLKLVFDTGNPISSDDRGKPQPCPRQSAWDFYTHVKEHVAYVHIKDGVWDALAGKAKFTLPGDGQGDVKRIVRDLMEGGYDGGFSIEPHMAVVLHDDSVRSEDEIRYATYVEYGRRFMRLLKECCDEKPRGGVPATTTRRDNG